MTNQDESFFQEVEEAVRQDRYLDFLRKYGVWVLAAIAAPLLGVVGFRGYQSWQVSSAQSQSSAYADALKLAEQGDAKAVADAFQALETKGPQTYRVMAMMHRAEALLAQGDLEASLAAFDAAAGAARDPVMRDTARLRAAYIVADTQDFAALRTRLQPLIDEGGALSFPARELLGVEAWEAGDTTLARTTLENLQLAFDAPEPIRQRAQLALSVIGPAPAQDAAAPSAAPESESSGEPK